jgi:hypothetical protein
MSVSRTFSVLFFSLILFSASLSAYGGELADRIALKRMCKAQYKACKLEKPRKVCRAEKKQCRRDNGVAFGDDLKFIFGKAKKIIQTALGKVKIERGEDDEYGQYTKLTVEAAYLYFAPRIEYHPPQLQSYVLLPEQPGVKVVEFYVYDSDFGNGNFVQELQTSPGRQFPPFFDGRVFDVLTGVQLTTKKGKPYQFYMDLNNQVFGSFLPSKLVGRAIQALNFVKNYFPYIRDFVANVKYVPINLKYKSVKIGRATLLSQSNFENSAGFVVLFDHQVIKETF